MTHSEGVPAWARPVLEALAQASDHRDWMSRAAEIDAAYQQLSDVCRAALASDAGTPEGEPVESLLDRAALLLAREDLRDAPPGDNRWRTTTEALRSGLVNAALRERPAPAPLAESGAAAPGPERIVRHPNGHLMVERTLPYMPTEAEEAAALTSLAKASPVLAQHATHIDGEFDLALNAVRRMFAAWRDRAKAGAAPDVELDRLLTDFGALMWDRGRGRAIVPNDIPQRKAIHAHVERVKREARGAGVASGEIVSVWTHLGTAAVKVNRMVPDQTSERRVVLDMPMEVAVSLRDLTHCVRDDPDRTYRADIEEVASALEAADVPYSSYGAKRFRGNVTAKLRPMG